MRATDVKNPDYFHRVIDCQWACPAHTPVPEYIRRIAQGDYQGAYLINWKSNVFPGILGRTCDRPCEPACRRGRLEEQPVAICRLKRVAADLKDDIAGLLPKAPRDKNGKRVACVGAGPASLTVARDLAAIGYEVVVFDSDSRAGGMMRSQIPKFRLPDEVIDEEVGYALSTGATFVAARRIASLRALIAEGYDAIFVGCGAPHGRDLAIPGRGEAARNVRIGIEWLASVFFGHTHTIGRRVVVLGGGNTAMDCCRSARRLGGEEVKVVVRSGYAEMKASAWEKEDAVHEGVEILNWLVPKAFTHEAGKLTGVTFERVRPVKDEHGRRQLVAAGEPDVQIPCDDVLIAVGQENAFPWIEADLGIKLNRSGYPAIDPTTFASSLPGVFFGGDAAFGPKNIITAVAHGHEAAISIDAFCHGRSLRDRPPPMTNLVSQKMGLHEWSYDHAITLDRRHVVPQVERAAALRNLRTEVELGFSLEQALGEARRCLNCDVQTVFSAPACIECDACVDICPIDCISFVPNAPEDEVRRSLNAPAVNLDQPILVSEPVKSLKVMVKDEDLCLHCGLCADRCPTGAWDMEKYTIEMAQAGHPCRSKQPTIS
ncbi:NADPH-dependent glutamate synthase beta subunit-like oxidoreductase [Roseiarcus fermentans]|uniref:dihydrouracil dehydrogenase (NAD(+)) n=1 Tax=Roseiarcus fermentans TaxID=1473586 RepID=A0A366EXG0_9HYPH|nr:FAD-dependent oxidoreductase [Roseiarcus fermentans]RBP06390.1 NADPH-dependent glutamate synthase beta subunit-like oxidoreductase [Roseiarcus fermentans]